MKAVKLSIIVEASHEEALRKALANAGAGRIGEYRNCQFITRGKAQFYATDEADPSIGKTGELNVIEAVQIETWCSEDQLDSVIDAV